MTFEEIKEDEDGDDSDKEDKNVEPSMQSQEEKEEEAVAVPEQKADTGALKPNSQIPYIKKWVEIDEEESDEEQEVAQSRSKTVFFEICRVFRGILKNGESKNLKVKHIALYTLFPKLVNITLPFITHEHSDQFLRILVRGALVDWGTDAQKIKHFEPHLEMASNLVTSGGLHL